MNKILIFIFLFIGNYTNSWAQVVWEYPVKPGSEKWNALKTFEERVAACNIPEDIMNKLTTTALIEACMDYPIKSIFFIYNTPQISFDTYLENFNGVRHLNKRQDLKDILFKKLGKVEINYNTVNEKTGLQLFGNFILLNVIAQDDFLNSCDIAQMNKLLNLSLKIHENYGNDMGVSPSISYTYGRIIAKILFKLKPQILSKIDKNNTLEKYRKTGALTSPEFLEEIIKETKKYKENEK
jgi:hypothetical protein